jgi:hypothetical protein
LARTIVDFPLSGNFWPIVEQWAAENGYRQVEATGSRRVYQKGRGFWVAPMMLQLDTDGGQVHMEAWIRANLFVRIMSFFVLPAEMGIESGGFRGVLPRNIARGAVNKLLQRLGQREIG